MDLVSEARQRVKELEKELRELKEFLGAADRITRRLAPVAEPKRSTKSKDRIYSYHLATAPEVRPVANRTADMVQTILATRGEVHLDKIIDELYGLGWRSSGDRRKDYKNLHSMLSSKSKRFRAIGNGIFAVALNAKNPANAHQP